MNPFAIKRKIRKKKNVLNMQQRREIIRQLDVGVSGTSIAEEFNVTTATISKIKQTKETILQNIANLVHLQENSKMPIDLSNKKSTKSAHDRIQEAALLMWFTQQRNLGHPVSGPILKEKALQINNELNGENNFKASNGWLNKFCRRNGIKEYVMKGELLSADFVAAEEYKKVCFHSCFKIYCM